MRIAMRRADIKWVRFQVNTPNGYATEVDFTNIYFTVKRTSRDRDPVFQKSLKRGEIYKLALGDYQFKIDPKDTKRLVIGDYKFDIQLLYKDIIKETFVGDFALKEEITYEENESDDPDNAEYYVEQAPNAPTLIIDVPDYHVIVLETPKPVTEPTGSYEDLTEKPIINGHVVEGNMSLEDLGIMPADAQVPDAPLNDDDIDNILNDD